MPLFFGAIGGALKDLSPALAKALDKVKRRNEVTRSITFERRVNNWGYSAGSTPGHDNMLIKAVMQYVAKTIPAEHKKGTLTLTELPAKKQSKSDDAQSGSGCAARRRRRRPSHPRRAALVKARVDDARPLAQTTPTTPTATGAAALS